MKKLKNIALRLWKDESAQGTAEYILLLVVIVAVAILFKDKIMDVLKQKTGEVGSQIQDFGG